MQSTAHLSDKCRAPYWRVQLIPRALIAHLLIQIRHNLVVPEKPFFRRGSCVLKAAHHFEHSEIPGFRDETAADRFGFGLYDIVRGRLRAAVAACARRRGHSGGAGRSGATL